MSALNVKVDKFTGRNSFGLWQIKMRSLLKQQGLWVPLTEKNKKDDMKEEEWTTLEEKAHSTIMLCLSDDVIIEVADKETAAALWTKLESLYMTKSLTNKLLLKQRLFRLRMEEDTPLRDHLDKLNKILLDLRNVDVKVEDEDAALILLVSLPEPYENFVESFMVGKETLTMDDVRSALHIREDRQLAIGSATENQASGLSVTGKGQKKFEKKKSNSKSSRGPKPDDIYNYYKELEHWKFDCPNKNNNNKKKPEEYDEALSKGSRNGGVSAIVDTLPSISLFLSKYCHKYTTMGPTYKKSGLGFAFQKGSPLAPDASRAIMEVKENGKMENISNKWFGTENCGCRNGTADASKSLDLDHFKGLFLISGLSSLSALAISLFLFLYKNRSVFTTRASIKRKLSDLAGAFDRERVDKSSTESRTGFEDWERDHTSPSPFSKESPAMFEEIVAAESPAITILCEEGMLSPDAEQRTDQN